MPKAMLEGCRNRKGVTDLILRELKKRPLSHSELLKITGLEFRYLDIHMRGMLRVSITYIIQAGEWFKNNEGAKDRIYQLIEYRGKRRKKSTVKMSPYLPGTLPQYRTEERRRKLSLVAKARARLIKLGIYTDESEGLLCELFGLA